MGEYDVLIGAYIGLQWSAEQTRYRDEYNMGINNQKG